MTGFGINEQFPKRSRTSAEDPVSGDESCQTTSKKDMLVVDKLYIDSVLHSKPVRVPKTTDNKVRLTLV